MMQITWVEQITIGLWLSIMAGTGVVDQSWTTALDFFYIGAFVTATIFLKKGAESSSRILKDLAVWFFVGWVLALVAVMLHGAERVYWRAGESYPTWLTDGELPNGMSVAQMRSGECKDKGPIEITQKNGDLYFLRCGNTWLTSKIYYTGTNPMNNTEEKERP